MKMIGRMPKSKTSKHLTNFENISRPKKETEDRRGFAIVRFGTFAVLPSIKSIYHKQDFLSGQSPVDRDFSDFISFVILALSWITQRMIKWLFCIVC